MEGNGKKAVMISTVLALVLFASQGAITSIKKAASAANENRNRYKNMLLLDFELKDAKPISQGGTTGTNSLTFLIQGSSEKGELAGQSTVEVKTATTSYAASVRATMKAAPATGKKYVVWLKHPTGTEAIAIGSSDTTTVTVASFPANRDLSTYKVVVSQEDATTPASQPSASEVEAEQKRGGGTSGSASPTAGAHPTTSPIGGSNPAPTAGTNPTAGTQPTSLPGQPTQPAQPTTSQPTTSQPTTGQPNPTQPTADALNANIQKVIDEVKEANIRSYLEKLVDNDSTPETDEKQSRISQTTGNATEADYIKNFFTQNGIEAEFQPFTEGNVTSKNIVGKIYGADRSSWYIIMAHMDSVVLNSPGWKRGDPAPGADDNGSGTATVMEVARAIKASGVPLDSSLMFILFSGEEQGRLGSRHYANRTSLAGVNAILNLDMIGNKGSVDNCVNSQYKLYSGGNLIADEFVNINRQFNIGLTTRSSSSYVEWSDHHWFIEKGVIGSFLHECTFSKHWHAITDTTQHISFSQLSKTGKAVAGTLVKVSHTHLGKGLSNLTANNAVLGDTDTSNEAPLLIRVYYSAEQGPHELYELSDVPINYYDGEKIPQPFFLGLFSQESLTKVIQAGYSLEIIDENADLSLYELLWYPPEGGRELIAQADGVFTELSPHLFLLKYPEPREFHHEGPLAGFFDIDLPINSAPPQFKTPRITAVPTPSFEPTLENGRNWNVLIAIIFGLGTVLIAGIGAYLHKASRT